jgi:outer membrane protein OmpA-like peptidoglycan-associated protein
MKPKWLIEITNISENNSLHAANPGRISAYGVASLLPVASNSSAEGKAKNRREEIIEQ